MKAPTGCALWTNPEPAATAVLRDGFERLREFVDESHWSRSLLRCRECGQLYVFEFYEEIDWVDGDDPQYCTWLPVETDAEVESLSRPAVANLRAYRPHLRKDWPKGAPAARVYWVRETE